VACSGRSFPPVNGEEFGFFHLFIFIEDFLKNFPQDFMPAIMGSPFFLEKLRRIKGCPPVFHGQDNRTVCEKVSRFLILNHSNGFVPFFFRKDKGDHFEKRHGAIAMSQKGSNPS